MKGQGTGKICSLHQGSTVTVPGVHTDRREKRREQDKQEGGKEEKAFSLFSLSLSFAFFSLRSFCQSPLYEFLEQGGNLTF